MDPKPCQADTLYNTDVFEVEVLTNILVPRYKNNS